MNSNITPNPKERCVMARIQRAGKPYRKYFYLKDHGTYEAATIAAEKWVAKVRPTLPPKATTKGVMTERNGSGFVGVHYDPGTRTLRTGIKADYPGYVARWPDCPAGVKWMLSTYNGPENAFVHAVICRKLEERDRATVEEGVRVLSAKERAAILKMRKNEA